VRLAENTSVEAQKIKPAQTIAGSHGFSRRIDRRTIQPGSSALHA
jgi:hypothetical protein